MSTSPIPSTRTARWGGLILVLSAVQFLLAEAITASAWSSPHYSYARNFISDLGVTSCGGVFAGNVICSPWYFVMNTGFVLHGLLFALAGVLLAPLLATIRRRGACRTLAIAQGIGFVLVAIVHGSPEAAANGTFLWHGIGALLIIFGGNGAAVLVGADLLSASVADERSAARRRRLGTCAVGLGVVGPVALVLLLSRALPVPAGVTERIAIYPIMLVELLIGTTILWQRGSLPAGSRTADGPDSAPETHGREAAR